MMICTSQYKKTMIDTASPFSRHSSWTTTTIVEFFFALFSFFFNTMVYRHRLPTVLSKVIRLNIRITGCLVSIPADPATILSCVAIDAVGLVQVTKGNIRAFCTMAERFMECVKTKTRGCIGEEVRTRSIDEPRCPTRDIPFVYLVRSWLVVWTDWTIAEVLCE